MFALSAALGLSCKTAIMAELDAVRQTTHLALVVGAGVALALVSSASVALTLVGSAGVALALQQASREDSNEYQTTGQVR